MYSWRGWVLALLVGALPVVPRAHAAQARLPMEFDVGVVPGVSSASAVAPAQDGFVWIGSHRGLCRWDGASLRCFDGSDANWPIFPGGAIAALAFTTDGTLWIGTDAGLWRLSTEQKFIRVDTLNTDRIAALAANGSFLWAAVSGGLAALRAGNWRLLPWPAADMGRSVVAMEVAADGSVRVLTGGRIARADSAAIAMRVEPLPESAADLRVGKGHVGRAGWIGAAVDGWPVGAPDVIDALTDRDGVQWTSTYAGVYFRFPGDPLPGTRLQALPHTAFMQLREDGQGNVWTLGFGAPLFRISTPKRSAILGNEGRGGDAAFALVQGNDGTVHATTEHGLRTFSRAGSKIVTPGMGLPSFTIRNIAMDGRNGLWMTALTGGLIRYANEAFAQFGRAQGLPSDTWRAIAAFGDDVWAASQEGGVVRLNAVSGDWQPFAAVPHAACAGDAACAGRVWSMTVAERGQRLWLCTEGAGLLRVDGATVRRFGRAEGLVDEGLRHAVEDERGVVWLGSQVGLFRLDDRTGTAKVTRFGSSNGMPDQPLLQVVLAKRADGVHELWLGTRSGVLRVSRADLDGVAQGARSAVDSRRYTVSDGLAFDEIIGGFHPGGLAAADGRVWFSSVRGVIVFDPNRFDVQPRTVRIESVLSNRRFIPPDDWRHGHISLPAGQRDLEIAYTAPVFTDPQRVRFSYRLKGLDDRWIAAGTRRTAYYTHLLPGRYEFAVRAEVEDGIGHPAQTTLSISIAPYFHETQLFSLAIGLAVLGLAVAVVRLRTRRISKRYTALAEERSRIARDFHDTLGQVFAASGLQLDSLERALPPEASLLDRVRQVRQSLAHGRLAARRALWEVRRTGNASPQRRPLIESLRELATLYDGTSLIVTLDGEARALPFATEEQILRIAEEAVSNAVAHGRALRVTVELQYESGRFSLWVRDDGKGFDAALPAAGQGATPEYGGLGLVGMRERARSIGGALSIHSEPGVGSEVGLVVATGSTKDS